MQNATQTATTHQVAGIETRDLRSMVAAYERRLIEEALEAAFGNQRRAAAWLGVLPTTLHEKMKRLGLIKRTGRLPESN